MADAARPGAAAALGLLLLLGPMSVAAAPPPFTLDLRVTPTTTGARLRLTVQDSRRHAIVRRFAFLDEQVMQLFLVGDGLTFFAHEYPQQQSDGVFMTDVALPKAGPYMAVAEFQPEGSAPQTSQQSFTTGEAFTTVAAPALDGAAKVVGGARVSLDAATAKAGERGPLVVRIDAASTLQPIADLQPLAGSAAQLFVASADLTEAFHVRPDGPLRDGRVTFTPLVPRPGRYKVWVQFRRGDAVSTASFVIEVP